MASSGSPPSRETSVAAHQSSSVDPNDLTGDCWKLTLMDFWARLGTAPQQLRSGELLLLLIGLLAVATPLADALLPPFAIFAAFRLLPAVAFVPHSANLKIRSLLTTSAFIDIALAIITYGVGLADLVLTGWTSLLAPLPILFFIVYQEQHSLSAVIGVIALRTFAKRALLLPHPLRPFVGYAIAILGLMSAAASAASAQRDRPRHPSNGPSATVVDSSKRLSGLTPTGRKSIATDLAPSPVASMGQRSSLDRGPPPAASSRFGSLTDAELHRGFAAATRTRRTSLPASAGHLLINRAQSNVSEARGLIADMLANRDLPGNVISCLRAVASLLNPQQAATVNLHMDLGLPRVVENPYSGEQLIVAGASKPRVTNITFSTVTSATGLPTIVAEPSRSRSSSFWKPEVDENGRSKEEGSESSDSTRSSCDAAQSSTIQTMDGTVYDRHEIDSDALLARVRDWNFPIFVYASQNPNTVLSKLAYTIFKRADLFRIFKVSPVKFFNYFHALEKGYWDIPYHNRLHAADVLHGCCYLTTHAVNACSSSAASPTSDSPENDDENTAEPLVDSMNTLEIMALYTAAAMHDFDHPGRTNAFLVAAEDRKAILYNDRSVLENHHAAESWRLLCRPENAFIEALDPAETKRFRYLVLEYILATDLKQHFDIIMQFNGKVQGEGGIDLSSESDRVLMAQMVIKMADINSPCKPYDLHRQWTDRICSEFYAQGDEEKRLGMAVSPYMDRNEPQVAKLQDSFIAHIVSPLTLAMNEAGLLPIMPGYDEPELLICLKQNHQTWLAEISTAESANEVGEKQRNSKLDDDATGQLSSGGSQQSVGVEDQHEMTTIQEKEEDEEYL